MIHNLLFIKKLKPLTLLFGILLFSVIASAQGKISGKVIGADDKNPIAGATVKIRGIVSGSVTDVNGNFSINAKVGDAIIVSYIGYYAQEVIIKTQAGTIVTLNPSTTSLNELVVTGYTSQRKKDISGAVATVNVNSAIKLPVSSSDQLLQGQAAGVTVIAQGAPGAGAQILVRGISNFGNSAPLIIIDGIQGGSFGDVNPTDIESISVLKDAGATAIYGVAGGNGVVLITTKKGKVGKTVFNYDSYYGTQVAIGGNPFNTLNAANYEALIKQVDPSNTLIVNGQFQDYGFQSSSVKGVGSGSDPRADPSKYKLDQNTPSNDYLIQKFDNGQGTDWFHQVFKSAPIQQQSISASGANDKNSYFLSLSYLNAQGTLIDTYFKRYSTRVNTVFGITDHFRIGENIQLTYSQSPNGRGGFAGGGNQNEGNAISETYRIEPQIPVYDIAGNYGGTYAGPTQLGNAVNPVAAQARTVNNHHYSWNIEGTVFAEVDLFKHLTAKTSFSGVQSNYQNTDIGYRPYDSGEGHGGTNSFSENAGYNRFYNWSNTLVYKQIFGKHNITILGGFEQRSYDGRFLGATVINLTSLDPAFASVTNGTANAAPYSGANQPVTGQSYFARLDYIFADKYILAATVRRDGESVFFPGKQYGTFPSVSLAWRVSQEDFMKGVTWVNDLKIRGSYGESGFYQNVPGGNGYSKFGLDKGGSFYAIDGSSSNITQGFYNTTIGNQSTSWERDKTLNFGFDATLFNKLDITAEYFKKTSSDLLANPSLPATVGGAAAPFVNIGEVQNKGFEAAVTYRDKISTDLSFSLGLNVTTYKNMITKLANDYFTTGSRIGNLVKQSVGHPIGSFYGYQQIGYFSSAADVTNSPAQQDAAPGRFKFADVNGDGKIDANDRTFIGNPNPDFTYGLNLNVNYRSFDLSANFYGSQGNKDLNYIKYWTEFYSSLTGNKSNDLLNNAWSPTNLNPKAPKPEATSTFSTDQNNSSYFIEDGSFLKLKVLQLGYSFAPKMLKNLGITKLRIYAQGTNLFTATKYTGLDPELQSINGGQNGGGIDFGNYPNNEKKYIFGVNLSF
jgi:TonB-linked SusC/RagA family outer membrane protein